MDRYERYERCLEFDRWLAFGGRFLIQESLVGWFIVWDFHDRMSRR